MGPGRRAILVVAALALLGACSEAPPRSGGGRAPRDTPAGVPQSSAPGAEARATGLSDAEIVNLAGGTSSVRDQFKAGLPMMVWFWAPF